ncbi:ABC-2 type transport system ATP-binding protein [Paenibacillus forsythiae]|uniref:ABC-2 type transport system ATP-binding protein n=1 Tax=Paenibacillus forsythiae TaxID=365616 RepID=A0ABU3HB82_9BACL|nr:ABC transporter ATP-binding protein [Paenibacillus forsythiae]MDT3428082.1 ABC-2 type transport system ATP-binding protein [Paenibacillus forsythiae]
MISIEGVSKTFGRFTALEDISFEIADGRICGLVGYNGAGKTTLLKMIAGIYRPEAGRITIDGIPVYENERLKRRLFMAQDDPYFLPQGSLQSMALFFSGFYPNWSHKTYRELVDFFELDPEARISGFSKGMQRQAALILAFATMPQYLLMDESFDGLDLSKRNQLKSIMFEYMKKHGTNIVISSHNLRELEGLCDYIAIIRDKRLSFATTVDEMRRRRTKYRVTFQGDNGAEQLLGIQARNITRDDDSYIFTWDGGADELRSRLEPASPIWIASEPMTLEEIFLDEMEDKEYDIATFF